MYHLQPRTKVVVGVDYGTTFTKVAFCAARHPDEVNRASFICDWAAGNRENCVPSRIAYVGTAKEWGYGIKPDRTVSAWTKLLIDRKYSREDLQDDLLMAEEVYGIFQLPRGLPKKDSALIVVQDFLEQVYKHILVSLPMRLCLSLEGLAFDFQFTVPVLWTETAQSKLKRAAKRAGFGGTNRPQDEVSLVTEAEAAAYIVLRKLNFSPGDGVLICDCGGGTVDIASYYIVEMSSPPYIKQICAEQGAQYGSTAVDGKLYRLLSERFKHAFNSLSTDQKAPGSHFSNEFEEVKRNFDGSDYQYRLTLRMEGVPVCPQHYNSITHRIILSADDIREKLFNPVINMIIGLVRSHLNDAHQRTKGNVINNIVLVGGFSNSPYLRQMISRSDLGISGIQIRYIPEPQLAVADGAVLRGLWGPFASTPDFPHHYGFLVCRPYEDGDLGTCITDPVTGEQMIGHATSWAIRRGEHKPANFRHAQRTVIWHRQGQPDTCTIDIIRCRSDIPPRQVDPQSINLIARIPLQRPSYR